MMNMEATSESKFVGLRKFNGAMGVLHLVQAALILVLSNAYALPVTTKFLHFDATTNKLVSVTDTIGSLHLGPMIAMFLLISAIAHFSVSTFGYKWYVRNLKKGMNLARWYEYAFSSSIMVVVIAMLCGIYELSSLILIFALNATMILFGLMMELHNQTTEKTDWTAFIFGCFAGFIPWVVLGIYFFGALVSAPGKVPTFVYFIFFSLAIFFNIFALNMALQYRAKGRWKDYLFGERVYVILSLVAKSALAWQVFGGTLRGA
jgi:hypothetical protein